MRPASQTVAMEPVRSQPESVRSQNVSVAFAVEGPLSDEERTLLDKMIAAMKLPAEAVKVVGGLGEATALKPKNLVVMQASGGQERGAFHDLGGVPAISTFHPRALLARPDDKRLAWDHLKLVLARLRDA